MTGTLKDPSKDRYFYPYCCWVWEKLALLVWMWPVHNEWSSRVSVFCKIAKLLFASLLQNGSKRTGYCEVFKFFSLQSLWYLLLNILSIVRSSLVTWSWDFPVGRNLRDHLIQSLPQKKWPLRHWVVRLKLNSQSEQGQQDGCEFFPVL